jgi:flagella synthesis protein FlgN
LQLIGDQRLIALTSLGIANNVEAIGDFLARDPKLLAKWDKLLQRADVARERNRVNGQLIAKRMQHNQQALTVLLNASNQPGLYGADGQHRAMGTGRSLGSA